MKIFSCAIMLFGASLAYSAVSFSWGQRAINANVISLSRLIMPIFERVPSKNELSKNDIDAIKGQLQLGLDAQRRCHDDVIYCETMSMEYVIKNIGRQYDLPVTFVELELDQFRCDIEYYRFLRSNIHGFF